MAEKVYGISGTNKCKKEVVSAETFEEYQGEVDTMIQEEVRSTVTYTKFKQSVFKSFGSNAYYTAISDAGIERTDFENLTIFTCEALMVDEIAGTCSPIPVVGSLSELSVAKDKLAMYYQNSGCQPDGSMAITLCITNALRNTLNNDNKKLYLMRQRYTRG